MEKFFYVDHYSGNGGNSNGDPLGAAKSWAQNYANKVNEIVYVISAGSGDSYFAKTKDSLNDYEKDDIVATFKPGIIWLALTPEEAQIVKDVLDEEKMGSDGFHGGMFKTPTEQTLWDKICAMLGG